MSRTHGAIRIGVILAVAALAALPGWAQDDPSSTAAVVQSLWNGPVGRPGSWFLPYNWTGGVPDAGASALIGRDKAVIHGFNTNTPPTASAATLTLGGVDGAELEILAGGLDVGKTLRVGWTRFSPVRPSLYEMLPGRLSLVAGEVRAAEMAVAAGASLRGLGGGLVEQKGGTLGVADVLNLGDGFPRMGLEAPEPLPVGATDSADSTAPLDMRARYLLSDGLLVAKTLRVGARGNGQFRMSGGRTEIYGGLEVSGGVFTLLRYSSELPDADLAILPLGGECLLEAGRLNAAETSVGNLGGGRFVQTGGEHLTSILSVGSPPVTPLASETAAESFAPWPLPGLENLGDYRMSDGVLKCQSLYIGGRGLGRFTQRGGEVMIDHGLDLGQLFWGVGSIESEPVEAVVYSPKSARYQISGGRLEAASLSLSTSEDTSFVQTGGEARFGRIETPGAATRITLLGGSLLAGRLRVGGGLVHPGLDVPPHVLRLGGKARLTVSDELNFGRDASFLSEGRCGLRLHGGSLVIRGFDSEALAALGECKMVMTPGDTDCITWQGLEAAGEDRGHTRAGFWNNFVIEALVLDGAARVRLLDDYTNQPDSEKPEALYVRRLVVGEGSVLDLNGLKLYTLAADIRGKIIDGEVDAGPGVVRSVDQMSLLPGDINLDGVVDVADFVVLKSNYGQSGDAHWSRGDLNGDGCVNVADFVILKANFGTRE